MKLSDIAVIAMRAYGLTVLIGAFLLFSIQPIAGKVLLPRLGGSTSVWSAALLFFMTALLLGYAYSYVLCRIRFPAQLFVHTVILLGVSSFVVMNFAEGRLLFHQGAYAAVGAAPFSYIFWFLTTQIGVPYILLSGTSTLLQIWFGAVASGRTPYRLYAFSNAGSLAAVAAYPFVIEPYFPLSLQMRAWLGIFILYAAGMLFCMGYAFAVRKRMPEESSFADPAASEKSSDQRPGFIKVLCWIGLAALASFQLITTTATITQGIAAVPFFWLVPLALYLFSYVLCFSGERWYSRMLWAGFLFAATFFSIAVWTRMMGSLPVLYELAVYSLTLFCLCMVCHGELYRRRPGTRFISGFYLASAFGGALGGFSGSILSPAVFTRGLWEFPFGLLIGGMVGGILFLHSVRNLFSRKKRLMLQYAIVIALVVPFLTTIADQHSNQLIETTRNFYGVLKVEEGIEAKSGKLMRSLDNGRILHGNQFTESSLARIPTTYFGFESGAGLALRLNPLRVQGKPIRVGVIGLGAGTLASYCREGDNFRFYELNPAVIEAAQKYFSYLSDCPGSWEIVEGDARVALEEERRLGKRQKFDVFLVDAFTDDAIPAHLLTREALALYADHLDTDHGLLGIHISNIHLDLAPLAAALARDGGWESIFVDSPGDVSNGGTRSQWMLLSRDKTIFQNPVFNTRTSPLVGKETALWTDDYSSIFEVLR